MALLARFFLGWFSTFASFFAVSITRKFAITLAVGAILITVTAAFYLAMRALISGLAMTIPPEMASGLGAFIPGNALACVAAYCGAKLLAWAYWFNRDMITLYMTA